MNLKQTPDLLAFLSRHFSDGDPEQDSQVARAFAEKAPAGERQAIIEQTRKLLADSQFPLEEIGTEANRWFGEVDEARSWLEGVLSAFENVGVNDDANSVDHLTKDSNGTSLAEGDSVTVIKDLKVRGGSNDLKRGTLIKKIHLIGDPENIECRVDGSTLVLKTCFLKKA